MSAAVGNAPEPCGVVVVDKPAGMTSFDVVAKLRRAYGTRRIGHTGTLDPMATGVLVVLVGRAAKAAEYVSAGRKVYDAALRLGVVTDTEDITGTVLLTRGELPTAKAVEDAAGAFVGEYMQTPPMFSAKKRGGERLYELARRGVTVGRDPVKVEIYDIAVSETERADEYNLRVACSGGTYIRTLCADIGERLGCGGCMAALRRLETGGFEIGGAHTIEEIEHEPGGCLLPLDTLFFGLGSVTLDAECARRIRCGQRIAVGRAASSEAAPEGADSRLVRLYDDGGFFALGEMRDGLLRLLKLFIL